MTWNPEKKPYCKKCPNYQPVGQFVYELQRSLSKRECQHAKRCARVDRLAREAVQIKLEV